MLGKSLAIARASRICGYVSSLCTYIFSRMRSKGSRFILGVWGLRACSLDIAFMFATVRNRPQPSATVRNRSQPFATVRNRPQPFATVSFRVAGVARRDIQTCFVTCRKSFCVVGAKLLCRFQKMGSSFRGRCRVACFLRIALSGLRQVATRCKFPGRRGIL